MCVLTMEQLKGVAGDTISAFVLECSYTDTSTALRSPPKLVRKLDCSDATFGSKHRQSEYHCPKYATQYPSQMLKAPSSLRTLQQLLHRCKMEGWARTCRHEHMARHVTWLYAMVLYMMSCSRNYHTTYTMLHAISVRIQWHHLS